MPPEEVDPSMGPPGALKLRGDTAADLLGYS